MFVYVVKSEILLVYFDELDEVACFRLAGDDRGFARVTAATHGRQAIQAELTLLFLGAVTLEAMLPEDRFDVAGEVDGLEGGRDA